MKKLILDCVQKAVSIMLTALLLLSTISFEVFAEDPKISIIIPVYNTPWNLLRDCLESAKNQTLKDIEIICVDDGSTDGSGKILDEYAKADPRFVVVHQENKGLSGARNSGMEIAKGEYIKFLDSDDMIDAVAAEKSYNVAKEYDADITRYSVKDCERAINTWARFCYAKKFEFINDTSRNFRKLFTNYRFFTAWGALFKNKFLKDNNIKFFQTIRFGHEDVMFNFLCYFHATKMIFMPDRLYTYRFNNQSLIKRPDFGDALRNSATEGIKYLYSHFKDLGYLSNLDMKIDFLNLILRHHEFAIVRDIPPFQKSFIESIDPELLQDDVINKLPIAEKIKLKSMLLIANSKTKPQKTLDDGIYTISSKLDPNMCLAIKGGSKNNCANLQLSSRNGTDAQKFKVQYHSDGYYTIKTMCSGKMLDMLGGSKNILQCAKNKRNTQKWFIVPDGEGYCYLASKCNNCCMEVDDANVSCLGINGGDNQRFKLEKCEDKASSSKPGANKPVKIKKNAGKPNSSKPGDSKKSV